ncbi:MAG: alpha-ketoacid dehydrogenase subunit beta [Patescibacteria group bacterium]|nr:alpha-ketoacid dehydrogenase subunit beta [Patescibacteria group bacterium]MDE2015252.1 alpha-ketoacid dehydrogenase subunit beta [Patescibacteria group bacterium]MDE2227058.1 alpha-ketoacid dehydrogenase subunit beta [Patescibacteria group bacterium]
MPRIIQFTEAIREATDQMMEVDKNIFVMGLGVTDKGGADGTTNELNLKYPGRILDVPLSEGAFTGMAVGAAINGLRPIVHHGRVEFSLFAADQIFTQAAKWNYMFGGNNNVPLVLRVNVGRQWGNGPQHTQSLYALFGSVPGLKVVIPSTPRMAKGLLVSALRDKNPVVILESRWIFKVKQDVPDGIYAEPLGKSRVAKDGKYVTVVAYGDGFIAAHEALSLIGAEASVELIDLVSLNPIDHETILNSVKKTGRLICVDTEPNAFDIGSEIISKIAQERSLKLKDAPVSISCPNTPCPTSTALTEFYYPTKVDVANAVLRLMNKPTIAHQFTFEELHLAPNLTLP